LLGHAGFSASWSNSLPSSIDASCAAPTRACPVLVNFNCKKPDARVVSPDAADACLIGMAVAVSREGAKNVRANFLFGIAWSILVTSGDIEKLRCSPEGGDIPSEISDLGSRLKSSDNLCNFRRIAAAKGL
jgi:hypothetical protein